MSEKKSGGESQAKSSLILRLRRVNERGTQTPLEHTDSLLIGDVTKVASKSDIERLEARRDARAEGGAMATYRVVLQVEVRDEDVLNEQGDDYLKDLKESDNDDYLAGYVEHELGWAEHSFSRMELKTIKRIRKR